MPLRIINDLHLGVQRSAGTTPTSRLALRHKMLNQFMELLPNSDLMILGDLFDSYEIPASDILDVYQALKLWRIKGYKLYMVPGNHDLSKTSTTLSSFQFLCAVLESYSNVQIVDKPAMTPYGYVIPHLPNSV
jgi:DNA repair exonuclease SbcCD nuclease subunit